MKKTIILAILAMATFALWGCSSKNDNGVEITKGWFAMNSDAAAINH